MKPEYKEMVRHLIKNVSINLLLTGAIICLILIVLSQFFNIRLQISSTALALGIVGTTLAFAGNSFVSDALGRYGAHGLPQYIWGNRMQTIGFALTIAALLVK
jgi:hypothetical protein